MFDPRLGRFLQPDPLGFEAGDENLYRFVGNTPTTFTDPSGLSEYAPGASRRPRGDLNSFRDEYKKNLQKQLAAEFRNKTERFLAWLEQEKEDMDWLKNLKPPPDELVFVIKKYPQLPGYRREFGSMSCIEEKVPLLPDGWKWDSKFAMNTLGYHPNAVYGIRRRDDSGAGQQAMYDKFGKLITGGLSAGTPDRVSPDGTIQDFWAHQAADVEPFNLAWELDKHFGGDTFRKLYLQVRPPNTGTNAPPNVID